jgi:hypothetical protein
MSVVDHVIMFTTHQQSGKYLLEAEHHLIPYYIPILQIAWTVYHLILFRPEQSQNEFHLNNPK